MGKRRSISFPKGEKNGRVSRRGKRENKVCVFWVGGREKERENMSECGGRRGNERILYIFFVSVISLLSPI